MSTTARSQAAITTTDLALVVGAVNWRQQAETLLHAHGAVILRGILDPALCAQLRERVDRIFAEPHFLHTRNVKGRDAYNPNAPASAPILVHRLFELDPRFRDLLVREPIIDLAEQLLGSECHCIAQGCILNRPERGIGRFHVDDDLEFPLPDTVERHDPRIRVPLLRMSVQIALSDQDEPDLGPSEIVPGSHCSGRRPNHPEDPEFLGQGAVPLLMRTGDCYLMNGQTWHRGRPNRSDRTRYLLHQVYGQRFVAQRFWPYLNYHMPPHVLAGADERLLRVLGAHHESAYG